jgi:glutamine amidotransferase
MCRVLGCVAADQVTLRHELLEAPNPVVRQSEHHDSGWGMAVYRRGDGDEPQSLRFPEAAFSGNEIRAAAELRGRIFNVHVRRATFGGLAEENTHPFCLGSYSFSHNGTIIEPEKLLEPGVARPRGSTDSECFFNLLMRDFDPQRAVESLRRTVTAAIDHSPFSGLNFLLSDGERLYAYRLGVFELHWRRVRPGQLVVSSERLDEERWHDVRQDVLLVLDPNDPEEPHAERLVGDAVVARAHIDDFNQGSELQGRERGEFAAKRAARLAAASADA